jgi:hypothetical protein
VADHSSSPEGRSLAWPGQIAIAMCLMAIVTVPTSGWGSAEVALGMALAAVFTAGLIAVGHGRRARRGLERPRGVAARPEVLA